MNEGFYNTHTISDSDDNSVINENHQIKISPHRRHHLSSSEDEPDFFHQVILRQKRKKSISPDVTLHHKNVCRSRQNGVHIDEIQKACDIINDPELSDEPSKQRDVDFLNNYMPKSSIPVPENSEESTEMLIKPKRKKRLTAEEMEEKKKEEKAAKDAKKKLTEKLKRLNPKECMKYMTVHIDTNLQNCNYSEELLSQLKSTDANLKVESNANASHSITWSRQTSDNVSEDESFMVLIWDFDYIKNLIESGQLIKTINSLKLYKTQLSIIIYSTADQLKKTKSKKNGSLTKFDLLNSLQQMMLSSCVSFRFIENEKEIGLAILCFTKSIAQKPFKLNKYKEEQEGCDWYASGHTKNCVTIDKNGVGKTQLWRQMLSQFPLCTLETSEAIASMYESPVRLLEAYNQCSSKLEGETLLQDIPVRRGFGPLASNRRIGPELSKKIYTFFTDNTGCTTLSQDL